MANTPALIRARWRAAQARRNHCRRRRDHLRRLPFLGMDWLNLISIFGRPLNRKIVWISWRLAPNHQCDLNLDCAVDGEAQGKAQAFRSERNRPVPLSAVAGIGAMSGVLNAANEAPSNKNTLKHYGRCVRCSRLTPRPAQVIQLNCGIRVESSTQ